MFEWLAWDPKNILGVSKNEFRNKIIRWTHDETVHYKSICEKAKAAENKHEAELERSEALFRYDKIKSNTLVSVREALRRALYFSENYLNKEFDIFMALASDRYLDKFYGQFTKIQGCGKWCTHGKNMVFEYSTEINFMQMDNLAYNHGEKILIANELKLSGTKNGDQILKYAKMFYCLREKGFIDKGARFLLLFIGKTKDNYDWSAEINKERERITKDSKKEKSLGTRQNIDIAKKAAYHSITWGDVISFNEKYLKELDPITQQVEQKLITGFNDTLSKKAGVQVS